MVERLRHIDGAFCMTPLGGVCGWCARIAALETDELVEVTGEDVWRALFNPVAPRAYGEFLHDPTTYLLEGDRLTATPTTDPDFTDRAAERRSR
jgi:hypothetical protein